MGSSSRSYGNLTPSIGRISCGSFARKASLALKSACLPPSLTGITAGVHGTLLRRPDAE